jgi:hypothetical protein
MKLADAIAYSTADFEYETEDGPVHVYYIYERGDPTVGLSEDYDIYIFDGDDDITFDSDHNLYLKIKKLVPDHHRKIQSDRDTYLSEP